MIDKKTDTYKRDVFILFLTVFSAWAIWTLLKLLLEFPYPVHDIFFYKDPGANLLFKRSFLAENLSYAGERVIYFKQGYIYTLLYGLWTLLVGFAYTKAIFFDSLIELARLSLTFIFLLSSIRLAGKYKTTGP